MNVPDPFVVTFASLTLAELAAIESMSGMTISETEASLRDRTWVNSATEMAAVMFVAGSRQFPDWTTDRTLELPYVEIARGIMAALQSELGGAAPLDVDVRLTDA